MFGLSSETVTMMCSMMLQVCRQLDALTLLGPEHGSDKKLLVLRK